jgi:hypothetical protein
MRRFTIPFRGRFIYKARSRLTCRSHRAVTIALVALAIIIDGRTWKAQWELEAAARRAAKPDCASDARLLGPTAVKPWLKHPLDAVFTGTTAQPTGLPDVQWIAGGLVKAPNGFGAPITSPWAVLFTENGEKLDVAAVKLSDEFVYVKAKAGKQE